MLIRYALLFVVYLLYSCNQSISYLVGGFDYPKEIDAKDQYFYIHPYKDSLTTYDSLKVAHIGRCLLKAYNEPNLSLRSQGETVFRFVYDGLSMQPIIIVLTEGSITVKQGIAGHVFPHYTREELNDTEQKFVSRAERYFRLNRKEKQEWQPYMDSLLRRYPRFNDVSVYQTLMEKIAVYDSVPFRYSEKRISISTVTFSRLVNLINQSGFWEMPRESDCENISTHAAGYMLEANTPLKYKIVNSISCPADDRKFVKACQELINYAGLKDKIRLLWG